MKSLILGILLSLVALTPAVQAGGQAPSIGTGGGAAAGITNVGDCSGPLCFQSVAQNTVFAGLTSGAGIASFRALVLADLPAIGITDLSDVTAISGSTTVVATTSGVLPSGNCASFDASGNIVDDGGICGGGAGAPTTAEYLVLTLNGVLTAERVFTAGDGIDVTDAGANGAFTVDLDLKLNGGVVIEATELAVDLGATTITGTLAVGDGGTGATSFTDGGPLLGSGVGAFTALAQPTNGQLIVGSTGVDPVLATISAVAGETDVVNGAGTITIGIVASPTLDGTNFTGIAAGAYAAASIDGDDIATSLAGLYLTLTAASPDVMDVDVELFEDMFSINIFDPTTADTNKVQAKLSHAVTMQRVSCSTDVGTATIQFDERVEATPNTSGTNVMTASLVCDTNTEATTSFTNAGIAADVPLNLQITATASTPTIVRIHGDFQIDD